MIASAYSVKCGRQIAPNSRAGGIRMVKIAVRRGGGYGDILLTTPVLRAIKQKFPGSILDFYTDIHGMKVIRGFPGIDRVVLCRGFYDIHYRHLAGYDFIYSLLYEKYPSMHIMDAYAKIADVKLRDERPELVMLPEHYREAERLFHKYDIGNDRIVIGFHRGPTWPCRTWHAEKFKAVADRLKRKYDAICLEFSGRRGYGCGLGMDLTGKTSIRQTAAILTRCRLLVCIDSFMLHLAYAMGTPAVAVFGCTSPQYRLPRHEGYIGVQTEGGCRGCYHDGIPKTCCSCRRDRVICMEEAGIQEVVKAAEQLIDKFA